MEYYLLCAELWARKFLSDVLDFLKYVIEEIRDEGKDKDEWFSVELEKPRQKLGSSR